MNQTTKYPWESKTIVLNTIMAILGALALFSPVGSQAQKFLQDNGAGVTAVWSVLNILLRAVTKDKIVLGD